MHPSPSSGLYAPLSSLSGLSPPLAPLLPTSSPLSICPFAFPPSFPSPGPLSLAFTLPPPPLFSNTQMFIIPHPTKTEKNYGYSVSGVIGEGRGGDRPCPGDEDESHFIWKGKLKRVKGGR